jgi:8-oxo-dGTP pyrophosphatase MutT (NUDIX family)
VRLTAEELPFTADLGYARTLLADWRAPSASQARTRDEMIAFIDAHPLDAHRRTCLAGHLTASSLVIDARGERALLTHHKKLGRWLQLGGHCDGDANLPGAALREAREESGIEELAIDPSPIDVDIHVIPARANEPEHLHLDTRFLVWAPPGSRAVMSAESIDLAWFTPEEAARLETDDSVRRLFRLAFRNG